MGRRNRSEENQSSSWPIILILGLVLGIPAIVGVVIVILIFGAAFLLGRAGKEIANEAALHHDQVMVQQQKMQADEQKRREDALKLQGKPKLKEIPNLPHPNRIPGTNMIDLIALIDVNRDKKHGDGWAKVGNELQCNQAVFVPRMEIPFMPPAEYDFTVKFSQPGLRNGISLIMPNPNGGSFFWYVAREGGEFGFMSEPNIEQRIPNLIKPKTIHTTMVEVRRNSLRAFVDGQMRMSFKTDFKNLTCDNWREINDVRLLAIACDDQTTFHEIRLTEVNGIGKRMR